MKSTCLYQIGYLPKIANASIKKMAFISNGYLLTSNVRLI